MKAVMYLIKPIEVKLSQEIKNLRLYPLADLHIGDKNCEAKKIKSLIDNIAADDSAYVILGGDLINNATKTSVSDSYSETLSPMEEMQRACELLEPIKNKVIAACIGNHEERTYKQDGIDIMRLIARQLGFENRYRPDFAYIILSFGQKSRRMAENRRQVYTIYVNHGNGGGRKMGGKANRLAELGSLCDADLFIVCHTHTPMVFKDTFLRAGKNTNSLEQIERTYVNTSGWLSYGGYGARQQYQPGSISCPCVLLDGTKQKIDVVI